MLVTCWCLINLVSFHFLQSKSSDSRFPLEPIINGLWRSPLYFQRNLRLASQQRVGLVGRASNLFPVSLQIYEKQNSFPNERPWLGSNQSRFFLKIIHTFFLHLFGFFFQPPQRHRVAPHEISTSPGKKKHNNNTRPRRSSGFRQLLHETDNRNFFFCIFFFFARWNDRKIGAAWPDKRARRGGFVVSRKFGNCAFYFVTNNNEAKMKFQTLHCCQVRSVHSSRWKLTQQSLLVVSVLQVTR